MTRRTLVLLTFSMFSLSLFFWYDAPMYLAVSAVWAGLAWFWQRTKPAGSTTRLAVWLVAVVIAAGEGYSIGRHEVPKAKPRKHYSVIRT
jgi:hypothetical protein